MTKLNIPGADCSFEHPDPDGYRAAGMLWIARYFGPGSGAKMATASEITTYQSHALGIVTLVEGGAGDMFTGAGTGYSHAEQALNHVKACGGTGRRPYIFAADKQITTYAQWQQCWPYLDAAASVLSLDLVWIYGQLDVMRWAQQDRKASGYFQTYAWSDDNHNGVIDPSEWFADNNLEQWRNGVMVAGAEVDLCRGVKPDYGQWDYHPTGGDDMSYRFAFDNTWGSELPPDLAPAKPTDTHGRIINADRANGSWSREPFSTPQGGLQPPEVLSKSKVASGTWTFAQTFANCTGGCTYDSATGAGLAPWRQASSGGGGSGPTAAEIAKAVNDDEAARMAQ